MKFLFHLFAFSLNTFTLWYDQNYVELPNLSADLPFKGRVLYLTLWCLVVQTLYFAVAILNDLIGTNDSWPKRRPLITRLRDVLFSSLAFPLATYVTMTFWSIYAVDRELILPKRLDAVFPTWVNHVMHTTVFIFIAIEMFTSFRQYPARRLCLAIILIFNCVYIVWVNYVYFAVGKWVYPILDVLNWPSRIAFFVGSLSISLSIYVLGEKLNSLVWPKQSVQPKQKKKVR